MTSYTKEQLREIFRSKFNNDSWKAILGNLFHAEQLRTKPEQFDTPDPTATGYYMGKIETDDAYTIGLFYYIIDEGSVAHKKVGLRNLVKSFINPTWGSFDAAIVVFNDKSVWRLSFICDIKEDNLGTNAKRYTFVFGEHDSFYRTAIERFMQLQSQKPTLENIRNAFSVEALSDDFFNQYREYYADFVQYINGKRYVKENNKCVEKTVDRPNPQYISTFEGKDKLVRDYVKKMFGRIVFLYFLQRKGWLNDNRNYMHDLFYNSNKKDDFLDGVLEPLFFHVLNTEKEKRTSEAKALPGCDNIPYLNGGLFAADEIDDLNCKFPAEYFKKLFDFLDSYNFTIDENDSNDAEIGIDPEMLGRIFENLLEDNKDKGAFYTPKEIVDYMCRESLIAYLNTDIPESSHSVIRNFVETLDVSSLNEKQLTYLRKKLQSVKICDPAIGSGAFPMGLVNLLSKLYVAMKPDTDTSTMKRWIMEQNIYGVDIEKGAVDIARLRFWLAMIVEEKEPVPLPNLRFKIMQGNSLLENYNGTDLSDLTKFNPKSCNLFDSDEEEKKDLATLIESYYGESRHSERDKILYRITNNVRRQLLEKCIILPEGFDLTENSEFFLWHTWFSDVFNKGGFDIVIANPPYIDSETMTNVGMVGLRDFITRNFKYIKGNWDIYMAFFEFGLSISKGVLCYITPDKWLSKPFGSKFREKCMIPQMSKIVRVGSNVFENATVDAIISLFKQKTDTISACRLCSDGYEEVINVAESASIPKPYFIDSLFSIYNKIIRKIELDTYSLSDIALCENACATSDAYSLSPFVTNANADEKVNVDELYRLVNTGTIDKFSNRWGQSFQ